MIMKIKQEKKFTLPQLIEWIEINRRFNEEFASHRYNYVHANVDGVLEFTGEFCEDTFTVEVEEEITEDTEFKRLVYIDDDDDTVAFSNFTIRELKDNGVKEFHAYIDGEFKLVWRNGKLVEQMDAKELMKEENRVINRLAYWKIQKSNVEQRIKALECKRDELRKQRYKIEKGEG